MKVSLIDADHVRLAQLAEILRDLPSVEMVGVQQAIYLKPPPGLDCIFMTLPAAERWKPNFKSRQAQILNSSGVDQEKGFPPLIVTGVNLTSSDPKDPASQVRIVLESAFMEIDNFNRQNIHKIKNCGFWVMDLTRGVSVTQLSEILHDLLSIKPPSL